MKSLLFSPYLDTLGGGERYLIGVARVLAELGWQVDIVWREKNILSRLEDRFGVSLKGVNIVNNSRRGLGYDLCFWLSDGSVPFLVSRKNIIHFQVPFLNVGGSSLRNRIKFMLINNVVVNSKFTKRFIDREYKINSLVVYPPVEVERFKSKTYKKEKVILSVGRFSQLKQVKNQHILVEAFIKIFDKGLRDWKLILAGGSEVGSKDYLENLRKQSSGYPIEIIESPSFENILDLYSKSSIFWSASGYGVDEDKEPEKVEHFGITVVEAMASGCIPIIYEAGGHREIVENKLNGFLWRDLDELVDLTLALIKDDGSRRSLRSAAIRRSENFSYEIFSGRIRSLI